MKSTDEIIDVAESRLDRFFMGDFFQWLVTDTWYEYN